MTTAIKVSLKFATLPKGELGNFGKTILAELYDQSDFANPPVLAVDLQAGITAYENSIVAAANGGKLERAEMKECRKALLAMLKELAYFVQLKCKDSMVILLSSGFEAQSRNRTPASLAKGMIARIAQTHSTVALVTAKVDRGARSYEVQAAEIDDDGVLGPYGMPVIRTSSRKIPVEGLTPGKQYVFRVRSIGGKGEISAWSDPVAQRVV